MRMGSASRAAASQRTRHTVQTQSRQVPWSRCKAQATAAGPAIMDITSMGRPVMCATHRFVRLDSTEVNALRPWTVCVLCAVCLSALLARIGKAAHRTLTRSAPIAPTSPVTRPMSRHQARTWRQLASGHATRASFKTTPRGVCRATRRVAPWASTEHHARQQQTEHAWHAATTPPTLLLCLLASRRELVSMLVSGSARLATLRKLAAV